MSWGERSCGQGHPCGYNPTIETCNVNCPGYRWDGVTKPDSNKKLTIKIEHECSWPGPGRRPGWW